MPDGKVKLVLGLMVSTALLWANSPPRFTSIVRDTIAYEDNYWSTWLEASDPDDDPLTFRLLPGAPPDIKINSASGFLNWTPTNQDVKVYNLIAEVSDGSLADYITFNLYVRNTNDAPYWLTIPPPDTSIMEDNLYTFTLHANDIDNIHGDHLRYILKLAPTDATIDSVTGTIRWIPNNSQIGINTFSVWASDDSAATIQTIWNVQVNNTAVTFINSPPTTATEDVLYTFDLQSSDEGEGNVTYAFVNGYQPDWLSIDSRSGLLTGTPVNNQVGFDSVKIAVDDGNGSQASLAMRLEVINNPPRIAVTVLPPATEDLSYTADIDADDEGLGSTSYRMLSDPGWLSIDPSTGVISGIPDNSHVGNYPLSIEFDDGNGGKDTATLFIEVHNTKPSLQYTNLIMAITEDTEYNLDFNSSDDNQGNILYHSITLPAWLTLNPQSGVLYGIPTNEYVGANLVKIYVSDGNPNGNDTLEYTITVQNRAPVILSTPITSVVEDTNYSYDINTDDENHGAVYSLVTYPAASTLTIDAQTGLLSGTLPNSTVGSNIIVVQIDDGKGGIINHQFPLTVTNIPPRFTVVPSQTVAEDQLFTLDIATDDEDLPLVNYALRDAPADMTIGTNSGLIQWMPDNSQVGIYTITVLATDNHAATDSLTFSLQVQNVPPLITTTPYIRAREDSLYWYDANSTDENMGNTTYTLLTPVSWLTIAPQTGILQGTPTDQNVGAHNINILVNDGNGGTANQEWTITVNNLVPTITTDVLTAAYEDTPWQAELEAYPPGNYSWSLQGSKPAWLSINPASGALSGIPSNSDVGRATITVRVTDLNGEYGEKALTLDVVNVNPAFTTTGKIYVTEDQPLSYDLNTDDEGDEGNQASGYTLISYPAWLSCNPTTGVLTGTPRDADVGTIPLQLRYQDGNGGIADLSTEIIITNTPPQFTSLNPPTSISEDQLYSYQFTSDDDAWGKTTYTTIQPLPTGLTLTEDGLLEGTPPNAAVGTHSISILVTDGNSGTDTLSFNLHVYNTAPTFLGLNITQSSYTQNGDSIFLYEDLPYQFDFNTDDELDGQNAIYTVQSRPTWLNFTNATTGVLNVTPTNAHVGLSTLTVTFSDGNGGSLSKTYYLKVLNVPVQFTNTLTSTTAVEDQSYALDLNSSDDGQGTVTYSILSGNPGWLQINPATGMVTSIPDRPNNDDVTAGTPVTLVVDDGNQGRDTLTIIFIVLNTNDTPTWTATPMGTIDIAEDATYTTTLVASDVDVGDHITYSLTQAPSGMTLNSSTGALSWTPTNAQVGLHNIIAQAIDDSGSVITRSWNLNVTNLASPITALTIDDFSPASAVSAVADTFYIWEDSTYTLNLSAPDESIGANSWYSFDEFNNPNWITLSNITTGIIRLTPTNNDVGLTYFKVYFTDQPASADTAQIYLRVLNVPPVITTTGPFTATQGQAFYDSIRCTDHGTGNVSYSFLSGQPAWLSLDVNSGILTGTPSNSDVISNGSFTIQANDGNGGTDVKAFNYTVLNVNDPPIWTNAPSGTISTNEDALYTTTLTASDPDVGDQLTYSLLTKPEGMSINPSSGLITWTPDNSQVGSHNITAKVSDLAGAALTRSWTINVLNLASPITALTIDDFSPASAVSAGADTFYIWEDSTYTLNLSAPDESIGANSWYSFDEFNNPNWITLSNITTGIIRLTPTNNDVGLTYFKVYFTDQPASADTALIYLRVLNVPPVITTTGPFTATQGQAFYDSIRCTDHGTGNVSYSFLSGQPAWLSLDANSGILTGTPSNSDVISNGSFTIQANDGNGGTDVKAFNYTVINVNDPPVWTNAPSGTVSTNEDALYTTTLTASDPDVGDQLTYSLLTKPEGMSINPSSGLITWTPDNSQVGSHNITAKVSDLAGAALTRSWTINVLNLASPITALTIDDFSPASAVSAVADTFYIWEDSIYTVNLSSSDEGLGEDSYYDLSAFPNSSWLSLLDSKTGLIQLAPQNQHVGLDSIRIRFYDQPGSANDIKLFVRVQNTPPVLVAAGPFTATEDTPFTYNLDNSDEASGLSTYAFIANQPTWLNINPTTGQLSGTPTNADVGQQIFTIAVSDGNGGTAQCSYSINIINVNDTPTLRAINDTTILEDSDWSFTAKAQDIDVNDILTFSLVTAPSGMSIDPVTGVVSWKPYNDAVGTHPVVIKVQDHEGASTTQAFNITVQNVLPVFTPITITHLTEDTPFTYDLDCSDEGSGTIIYSLVNPPDWLTINPTTGLLSGTPLNSHVGSHSLEIQVNDGTASVGTTWNFSVINIAPLFTSIPDTTIEEDVLYTYNANSSDDNQGAVRYQALVLPNWLTLDSLSGIISGTPTNANVGQTLVSIIVQDGNGGSATQTFNLHVINTNDPPQATSIPLLTATEDSLYQITLSATDPDQDVLTFALVQAPSGMTIDPATGIIRWTPDNRYSGENVSVQAKISDPSGAYVDLDWTISVTNTPPRFITKPTKIYATEDAYFSYDFATDDEGLGTGSYTLVEAPSWLTLLSSSTGVISGTPVDSQVTTGSTLKITYQDDFGTADTLTTIVVVNNTAPIFLTTGDTTATEGTPFTYDIQCDDELSGSVNFIATSPLPSWLTLHNSTGILMGTPRNADVGTVQLALRALDTHSGFSDLSFMLTINNSPPIITTAPPISAKEDSLYNFTCQIQDASGSHTYTLDIKPSWLSINPTTGNVSGIPLNNHVGDNLVRITVTDEWGTADSLTFIVRVENSPPQITTIPNTTAQEDLPYQLDIDCSDENQGNIAYYALSKPSWLSLNALSGQLSGTPSNADVTDSTLIQIVVNDSHGGFDTLTFDLQVLNTAPQFIHIFSDTTVKEDDAFTYNIESNDESQGRTKYTLIGAAPAWLTLDTLTGQLSGTPLNQHVTSAVPIQIQVNDGNGGLANAICFLTVSNNPPLFVSPPPDTIALEKQLWTYNFTTTDEGQGNSSYTLLPPYPSWLRFDTNSGLILGTPNNSQVGNYSLQVQFSDGNGATINHSFQLTVQNCNDRPCFLSTQTVDTTAEDEVWTFTITAHDSDLIHLDTLTFSLANQPQGLQIDSQSGQITWTPTNQFVGLNQFDIIVTDKLGADDTLAFSLFVTNVNDPPQFARSDTSANEDQNFELLLQAVDIDSGDSLSYFMVQVPAGVTLNNDTLTWLPTNDQVGVWQFIVGVRDLCGATAQDTFMVTVQNTNDPPRLVKQTTQAILYEDSLWTYRFIAQDDDSAYGERLTFTVQNEPAGLTIVDSTGVVSWLPVNAQVGSDSLIVVVTDRAQSSDQLKFYLTIVNTNDAPIIVAMRDTSIFEDSLFHYQVQYHDVDQGDTVIFTLVTAPPTMQIDASTGWLNWRPDNDNRDQDFPVIVRVTDLAGTFCQDTFIIHVLNTNDPPVLADLPPIELDEDRAITRPISDWFSYVQDVDLADSLLLWSWSGFQFINVTTLKDSVRFNPNLDFSGNDTGKVIVSDGSLADTTELIITVRPINDPPVIATNFPQVISFSEDGVTSLNLNQYVTDVDHDTTELYWWVEPYIGDKKLAALRSTKIRAYQISRLPEASAVFPAINRCSGTSDQTALVVKSSTGDSIIIAIDHLTNIAHFSAKPDFFIEGISFRFFVTDSSLIPPIGFDSALVRIEVQPINDPPVLSTIPPMTVAEDSVLRVNLSSWYQYVVDVDHHDSTLTWTISNGRATQVQMDDKNLTIIPTPNWYGTDTLAVIVSDDALSDTCQWMLHYYSVNDPPAFAALPDTSFPEDDTLIIDLKPYLSDVETPLDSLRISATALSGNAVPKPEIAPALRKHVQAKLEIPFKSAASRDSITISIDPQTLTATIYGTPNYFTAPLPFKLTVYDDSAASNSIIWRIGIQAVNDPPVIAALPFISFPEDSFLSIALPQWYDYVTDVEIPDNLLQWRFESDTSLLLNYDTTQKILRLSAQTDWFGTCPLVVIVTDTNGASDTNFVNVTVQPRNDTPRINPLLSAQHLYQTDTLLINLSHFVTDADHPIDSLHWTIGIPQHVHQNHDVPNQRLKLWCGFDWFGNDTIRIAVIDPVGASDSTQMIITVADTTSPRFRFAIYQNQLTSKFVTIAAYPDERLLQVPVITINGDTCLVTTLPDSVPHYQTNFTIDSSMIVKVTLTGIDQAGNLGVKSYAFGVVKVSVNEGGTLFDSDSLVSFIFPSGVIPYDLCMLCLPEEEPDTLYKLSKSSIDGPVSPEFELLAPINQLSKPAYAVFNLARLKINQSDAPYLGLYYYDNHRWNYLKTYTGLETGTYWAYIDKPGKYQVWINTANPVTVLSNEFTLAPNYPNPFNSQTIIKYVIGVGEFHSFTEAVQTVKPVQASIRIYNLLGQEVKTLVNGQHLPGTYTVIWDGRNNAGQRVASGTYFCLAILGDNVLHRKMLLIK